MGLEGREYVYARSEVNHVLCLSSEGGRRAASLQRAYPFFRFFILYLLRLPVLHEIEIAK